MARLIKTEPHVPPVTLELSRGEFAAILRVMGDATMETLASSGVRDHSLWFALLDTLEATFKEAYGQHYLHAPRGE